MRANLVKSRFRERKPILNGWCTIASSHVAEVLAHAGFDSLTIDLQHGAIDYAQAFHMLQAISTSPAVPLARVPWNEPALMMKLLDAGAYGLICPMINSRREAESFVAACRYPPDGIRSYGPNRAVVYAGVDYAQNANSEILLLAQIETAEAVSNTNEILGVTGLDGIYVGPGDLSLSLGFRPSMAPTEPTVLAAMQHALACAKTQGKLAAVHTDGPATALVRYGEGFDFCSLPADMRLLADAVRSAVEAVKNKAP